MTREELKAWLETLKPGDEVAYDCSNEWGGSNWEILKVCSVKKTRIITECFRKFSISNGRELECGSGWQIQPVTDYIRERIHRQNLILRFGRLSISANRYTTEQLEAVIAILTGEEVRRATEDKNPNLEKCRGNHTDAMLRYEELLIEIARGEYSFTKDQYGSSEIKEVVRMAIVNCGDCDGRGSVTWMEGDLQEEDNCQSCLGQFWNIIKEYNL